MPVIGQVVPPVPVLLAAAERHESTHVNDIHPALLSCCPEAAEPLDRVVLRRIKMPVHRWMREKRIRINLADRCESVDRKGDVSCFGFACGLWPRNDRSPQE